jgi:hypothetical protein
LAMPTPVEEPCVATAPASSTSRKLWELLRRRLRQLLKATLGLMICMALFAIWWLTSLHGLPDVGDAFDVAAPGNSAIPEAQNAFSLFQRASAKLTPFPELPPSGSVITPPVNWSKLDPKVRAWVEAYRPALALFRQAADQSDGVPTPAGDRYWWHKHRITGPGGLMWLALLEGGRHAESGDTAAAWDHYRSVLRMTTHFRRRGEMALHYATNVVHSALLQRLASWAADPKTTIPQLRRALEEAIASKPQAEWDEYALQSECVHLVEQSRDSIHMALSEDISYRLGDFQVPTDLAVHVFGGRRFLMREPERSRRAVRLLYANWIAHVTIPELRRNKPAVLATLTSRNGAVTIPLYPVSPNAPPSARVLSPHEIASWLLTSIDAKHFLGYGHGLTVRNQELKGYRQLVVLLAEELYRRERGTLPPSDQALVGTYLETLPDDGSADAGDGTTPTVRDFRGQP